MIIFLWTTYFILCVIDVICAEKKYKRYAKGLLMPMLSLVYVFTCLNKNINIHIMLLISLFFMWIGDVALISKTKEHVIVGIITFMIGHIFYIITFLHDFTTIVPLKLLILIPYIVYSFFITRRLLPYVKKDMIPVTLIYIGTILLMSLSAYFRYPLVTGLKYYLTWIGTLCFMCSDTILSFQIYAKGTHHGVMILYLIAQTLIVISYLI